MGVISDHLSVVFLIKRDEGGLRLHCQRQEAGGKEKNNLFHDRKVLSVVTMKATFQILIGENYQIRML